MFLLIFKDGPLARRDMRWHCAPPVWFHAVRTPMTCCEPETDRCYPSMPQETYDLVGVSGQLAWYEWRQR